MSWRKLSWRESIYHWRDYVDAAWDEAINCSLFRNRELRTKVCEAVAELERRYNEPLSCAVSLRVLDRMTLRAGHRRPRGSPALSLHHHRK